MINNKRKYNMELLNYKILIFITTINFMYAL